MKRYLLTSIVVFVFHLSALTQTTHTINASGFSFSPPTITISVGDIVSFDVGSSHPVLEVSMSTWNSNGNTPLAGGFTFPSGSGDKMLNAEGTYYYICENHISSGMKGRIIVSTATNVNDLKSFKDFKVFPNPLNTNQLTIENISYSNPEFELAIFDITGKSKIVMNGNLKNKQLVVDCSELVSGIYIIQLFVDNTSYTSRIIKN
ncbi:T9SS type A sorting domain-containing protein [Bacteroidota bacterium]